MFFNIYLYNTRITKLSWGLLLDVDSKPDFLVLFQHSNILLTCSVASQECCINMWELEMLITGNDLQMV